MSSSPDTSILLPVYNGEEYLEECLSSVFDQTHECFELLVRDDGSTDRSAEILHALDDPRVRVLTGSGDENLGLFGNLNRLLDAAEAPLVRFLCQDDVLTPRCIEKEVDFFRAHPKVGMVFSKMATIDDEGTVHSRAPLGDMPEHVSSSLAIQLLYFYGCIPGNLTPVCVRRECAEAVGGFDDSFTLSGDYDMWARLCARWDLGVIHEHLVQVRAHPGRLSSQSTSQPTFIRENRRIRRSLRAELPAEIRSYTGWYHLTRRNVTKFHLCLAYLGKGQLRESLHIARAMGLVNVLAGAVFWLLTANNRLYRPQPEFVHSE